MIVAFIAWHKVLIKWALHSIAIPVVVAVVCVSVFCAKNSFRSSSIKISLGSSLEFFGILLVVHFYAKVQHDKKLGKNPGGHQHRAEKEKRKSRRW